MSDTLESVILDEKVDTTDGRHDAFQHYFNRKAIEDNIMDGKPMKALCGKIKDGGSQIDPAGLPICPTCTEIYNAFTH